MPKRKFSEAFEEELFHLVAAHDFARAWSKRFFKQAELILLAYLGLLPHSGEEVEKHYLWLNRANKQALPEDHLLLQELDPLLRTHLEANSLLEWFAEATRDRTPEEVEQELLRRGETDLLLELNESLENWKRESELARREAQQEPEDYLIEYDREMYERVSDEYNTQGLVFNPKPLNDILGTWGQPDPVPDEARFIDLLEKLNRYDPLPLAAWCESVQRGLDVRRVRGRPVPVVGGSSLRGFKVSLDYYDGVSEKFHQSPSASPARIQRNDVLLVGKYYGTVGQLGLYGSDDPALASDQITILRPNVAYNPYFLMLYLGSAIGQAFCHRAKEKIGYSLEISAEAISRFLVPSLPTDLQKRLGNTMARSMNLVQESEDLYARSEWARVIAKSKGEEAGWTYLEKFPKAPSPWRAS